MNTKLKLSILVFGIVTLFTVTCTVFGYVAYTEVDTMEFIGSLN